MLCFQYGHGVQRGSVRGQRAPGADGERRGGAGARRRRPVRPGRGGRALTRAAPAPPHPHIVPPPLLKPMELTLLHTESWS